jgi:MOSC domain-containing protein YiiM
VLEQIQADTQNGLIGDRYAGSSGKRQVTLIQWEHLAAIASMLSIKALDPALLRRNIAISGINLLALKDKQFQLGNAVLEYTGLCHPCSFMETTLGPGGYNAVRGHGGLTARVIASGLIRVNDQLLFNSNV